MEFAGDFGDRRPVRFSVCLNDNVYGPRLAPVLDRDSRLAGAYDLKNTASIDLHDPLIR